MDAPLVEFIQRFQSASVNRIMIFFSEINNIGLIWIILSLILILKNETRHLGIIILLSLIVTSILGEGILKNIIKRPRPYISYDNIKLLIPPPSSYSFPSGHVSSSFAVFGVFYFLNLRYKWPIFIVAFLISFSRIYLGVHYLTDILGGIILGGGVYYIICNMKFLKNTKYKG